MKIITIKVFSLCEDFSEEPFYEQLSEDNGCNCYITYTANSKEFLESKGFTNDEVANKLISLYLAQKQVEY